MFANQCHDRVVIQIFVYHSLTVHQQVLYKLHASALEPTGIRRRETLLRGIDDFLRYVTFHYLSKNLFGVICFLEVFPLLSRLIFVYANHLIQIV